MLELQNSMTLKKEPFEPINDRTVKMFSCGPSIYRRPHIGNYRTFIWEDTLQRYLEYLGYDVRRVLNFTDIEDKSIEEAQMLGESVTEVTGAVADRFMQETARLRIKLPDNIPRSSTSVQQAVRIIQQLIEKGYAYWYQGNVFYDPLKFKDFGKLYKLDMSRWPREKKRFKLDTYPGQRWNYGDFILWHGYKAGNPVYWDTEIGRGRPAWNIQDPAMISESLGYELDIFCGGIDNMVRHHDYNIAVMESVSGQELARYWLHGQHVLVNGKKMSKSLDNIVYPEDLLARNFSWEHIRFGLLYRHYRRRLNLTMNFFSKLGAHLDKLREMTTAILEGPHGEPSADDSVQKMIEELSERFESAMNNDLDTQNAFEGVFGAVSGLHNLKKSGRIGKKDADAISKKLHKIDGVLQVIF